jgi:hypothetical protein
MFFTNARIVLQHQANERPLRERADERGSVLVVAWITRRFALAVPDGADRQHGGIRSHSSDAEASERAACTTRARLEKKRARVALRCAGSMSLKVGPVGRRS